MSLSTRLSIAWPPDIPPQEPTNTLVLTFPSNHFIDLRPLKSGNGLDWGMAGLQGSCSTSEGTLSTPSPFLPVPELDSLDLDCCPLLIIARFIHVVDSRVPMDPLSVHDVGVFSKLENGDELEKGRMMNSEIGQVMAYEEVWRPLPVEGKGVVLLETPEMKDKTFVGRIGNWFQGIGTKDGVISAVRKEYVDGKWETRFLMGEEDIVPFIEGEESWKVGDEVEFAGRTWKVIDCEI